MFDINTIVNAAINAAVAEATRPLLERIETMEKTMVESTAALAVRCTALENIAAEYRPTMPIDEAKMVEALNSQEWFWEKLTSKAKEVADAAAEEAIEDHCTNYDHDDYDRLVGKVNELEDDSSLKEAIKDVLDNASFDIRVSF